MRPLDFLLRDALMSHLPHTSKLPPTSLLHKVTGTKETWKQWSVLLTNQDKQGSPLQQIGPYPEMGEGPQIVKDKLKINIQGVYLIHCIQKIHS